MSLFSEKLKSQIVEPAAKSRRTHYTTATVTMANEKLNICDITYVDKNGLDGNRNSVPVKIYNKGVIDWFPNVGDEVIIEDSDISITIIGPAIENYDKDVRVKNTLTQDILHNSFIDTMAGVLF